MASYPSHAKMYALVNLFDARSHATSQSQQLRLFLVDRLPRRTAIPHVLNRRFLREHLARARVRACVCVWGGGKFSGTMWGDILILSVPMFSMPLRPIPMLVPCSPHGTRILSEEKPIPRLVPCSPAAPTVLLYSHRKWAY